MGTRSLSYPRFGDGRLDSLHQGAQNTKSTVDEHDQSVGGHVASESGRVLTPQLSSTNPVDLAPVGAMPRVHTEDRMYANVVCYLSRLASRASTSRQASSQFR